MENTKNGILLKNDITSVFFAKRIHLWAPSFKFLSFFSVFNVIFTVTKQYYLTATSHPICIDFIPQYFLPCKALIEDNFICCQKIGNATNKMGLIYTLNFATGLCKLNIDFYLLKIFSFYTVNHNSKPVKIFI